MSANQQQRVSVLTCLPLALRLGLGQAFHHHAWGSLHILRVSVLKVDSCAELEKGKAGGQSIVMRQGNGCKFEARHVTAAIVLTVLQWVSQEKIANDLWLMILVEMCQNNSPCLIPTWPSQTSTSTACWCCYSSAGRHSKLLYGHLIWFSILGDYVRGQKGGYSAAHPVSYHPSKQIFGYIEAFVLHCDHSGWHHTSPVQHSFVVVLHLVCFQLSVHITVYILFLHSIVHHCLLPHTVSYMYNYTHTHTRWNVFLILIRFKTIICSLWASCQTSYSAVIVNKSNEPPHTPGIYAVYSYTNEQDRTQLIIIIDLRKCHSRRKVI